MSWNDLCRTCRSWEETQRQPSIQFFDQHQLFMDTLQVPANVGHPELGPVRGDSAMVIFAVLQCCGSGFIDLDPDPALQVTPDTFPVPDQEPGFWRPKMWKIIQGKIFVIFFWSKIAINLSLGLHKGRPSYRRSLQLSQKNIQQFERWNFVVCFIFFWVFFAPLDPDPIRIQIRIRIHNTVFLSKHREWSMGRERNLLQVLQPQVLQPHCQVFAILSPLPNVSCWIS